MSSSLSTRRTAFPWLLWGGLACLAAAMSLVDLADMIGAGDIDRALLAYSLAPRIVVAILAGAALGLSGALLQAALDNPLAEPSTLGVFAGAQLALGIAAVAAPALGGFGREAAAFAGGGGAAALVLALGWRRKLDPATVVLCGMVVAMVASSLTAAIILSQGEYLFALLIWGGGALTQEGWSATGAIAGSLVVAGLGAALLSRPLAMLVAGEASARSLGVPAPAVRIAALGFGVLLATTVAAEVGLIAFVGLAAPAFARLSGARSTRTLLVAPGIGAILLWLTDSLIRHIGTGESVPAGAATALLGAPLLLWLLPRLVLADRPAVHAIARRRSAGAWLAGLAALSVAAMIAALVVGAGDGGLKVATGADFSALLPFRAPRAAAAMAAGAMLAAAGVVLQRLTGNPLAGPEVLGVGAGAGVGLAVVLVVIGSVSASLQLAGAALGALGALVVILAVSGRGRLGSERMLLAGAGISALCLAGLNAVIASGSRSAFTLLGWMTGSIDAVGFVEAATAAAVLVVMLVPLAMTLRWLATLPLGRATASALGVRIGLATTTLMALASLLTGAACLLVGPLSFVGLVAPHAVASAGLVRPLPHLAGSMLAGGVLMLVADLLARLVLFPYQLPLGLFASLIGGAYLLVALSRR